MGECAARLFTLDDDRGRARAACIALNVVLEPGLFLESASPDMRPPAPTSGFDDFFLAISLHLLAPLLPLLFERWFAGAVSVNSLSIATSMYAIAIGNTSRSKAMMGIYLLIAIVFAAAYGVVAKDALMAPPDLRFWAYFALGFMFLSHSVERYTMHVLRGEPFWEF